MQQELIHHPLQKKSGSASSNSDVDKSDINKLKNVPTNLSNLKSKVDKLNVDKLVPVPANVSKLIYVVKHDVTAKMYIMLKIKGKILDITNLATNASLNTNINEIKSEIPSISNLATNAFLDAKINEVNVEIPSITNLATTTALTAVENKIPNVSNLV